MQYTYWISLAGLAQVAICILFFSDVSVHVRILALVQIALLYPIGIALIFQDFIDVDFDTLKDIFIIQSLFQMLVIEAVYLRSGEDTLRFEKEQLRYRFGLTQKEDNKRQYVREIMKSQLWMALYWGASSWFLKDQYTYHSYSQCSTIIFINMQLAKGAPVIVEATVGRLRSKSKETQFDLELTHRNYYDDEVPLWGSGKAQQPVKTIFNSMARFILLVLDYLFVIGTLGQIILFLSVTLLKLPSIDGWLLIDAYLPKIINRSILAILIKLGLLTSVLYLGDKTITQMNKKKNKNLVHFRKDMEKSALEGSFNIARMFMSAFFLMYLFYPSLILKRTHGEEGHGSQLYRYFTERIDYQLMFLGQYTYLLVLSLIKMIGMKKK